MSMFPIASVVVGAGGLGGDVSFTNIPQTYSHLQIRVFARSSYTSNVAAYQGIYFNGAPIANNYPTHLLVGDGGTATSSANLTNNQITPDTYAIPTAAATANVYGCVIWDILDYTSTTKNKTIKVMSGFDANGYGRASLGSGFWTSTAAITQVNVTAVANFVAGSRIDLYGLTTSVVTGA